MHPVTRSIARGRSILSCMYLLLTIAGCGTGDAGTFRVAFSWRDGQAPAATQPLFAWARLQQWPGGLPEGAITLSEAGPVQLEPGAPLRFENLSYGNERVVVVLIRAGDDPAAGVRFFGASEMFALHKSAQREVGISVQLQPAPGIGPDGEPIDADIRILGEESPSTGRIGAAEAALQFRVSEADTVTVANDPAFSLGTRTLAVEDLTPIEDDRFAWPEPWNLDEGLGDGLGDGTRSVFVRYANRLGLVSATHQASVFVDTSAPLLEVELNGSHFLADDTIRVTVNVNEQLAEGEPVVQVLGPGGFSTLLADPLVQGFSHTFLLDARPIQRDGEFTVAVTATDLVGHTAGPAQRPFTLDGTNPALLALPEVIEPAEQADGSLWAATGSWTRVRLETSEPLDTLLSRVRLGTAPLEYDPDQQLWIRQLDGSEGSGPKRLGGELADLAGNLVDLETAIADLGGQPPVINFDFEGPVVAGTSLVRTPYFGPAIDLDQDVVYVCPTDPNTGVNVVVDLYLFANEELGSDPLITAHGANHTFEFQTVEHRGQSLKATLDPGQPGQDPPPDDDYTFGIAWSDWLGNQQTIALDSPRLVVDSQPPAVSDLVTDAVVYHRLPCGHAGNGCQRQFRLAGNAGAVAGAAGQAMTVMAYLGDGGDFSDRIGAAAVADDGSFLIDDLLSGDHPEVSVRLVDRAGAVSEPIPVVQIAWTASLCGKTAGSSLENPHLFENATWHPGTLYWSDTTESGAENGLAAIGPPPDPVEASGAGGRWRSLGFDDPPAGFGMDTACDAARGKVVLFGGSADSTDTWEWNGATWSVPPHHDPEHDGGPAARQHHEMVYDGTRQVTVLFGGEVDQEDRGDTWEWNGESWAWRDPKDPENDGDPDVRKRHAMAYDSRRAVTVLFGGLQNFNDQLGDTWEWNGLSWAQRTPADPEGDGDPEPRANHAMAYDPARGVTVLFGGAVGFSPSRATWEWDGVSWRLAAVTGPPARQLHTMVYDPGQQAVVLFGGDLDEAGDPSGMTGDIWSWNGIDWALEAEAGPETPPPRRAHTAAFDASNQTMLVFGGALEDYIHGHDDTWEWDGNGWSRRGPRDPQGDGEPSARHRASLARDDARGVVVAFGGQTERFNGGELDETWEWDGRGWTLVCPSASCTEFPEARVDAAMADTGSDGVLLFGGDSTVSNYHADTWLWDGAAWTEVTPGSGDPPGRRRHAMAYDQARGVVVLFGGNGSVVSELDDTWEWNGTAWSDVNPDAPDRPPARKMHAMAYDPVRGVTVLFGGDSNTGMLDDTWEWNGSSWIERIPDDPEHDGAPSARCRHAMAYDPQRQVVVLFGGDQDYLRYLDDVWEWNGISWAQRTIADPGGDGQPSARCGHAMIHDGEHLLSFWGEDGQVRGDTWTFEAGVGQTPSQVFRVALQTALLDNLQAMESMTVAWYAGGLGHPSPGGPADQGAVLLLWDQGAWLPLAVNDAPPEDPARIEAVIDDPDRLARLLASPGHTPGLAVVPVAPNGSASEPARVSSDYLEVTVRYRRQP